jgi:hypothetical protein
MAGPIMHRRSPETAGALVVRTMILPQSLKPIIAPIPIKPQPRYQHLTRVYPILNRQPWHNAEIQSQVPGNLFSAFPTSKLSNLYIMRRIMCPI